jgi:hypothetical protein
MKLGEKRRAQKFAGGVVVAFTELAGQRQGSLTIAISGRARHLQQLVGDAGHSADHDNWVLLKPAAHDLDHAPNGLSITYRGATEFHDDAISH